MVRQLGVQQTLEKLREAVQERGSDYIYRKAPGVDYCMNWHGAKEDGEPGCIVGLLAYRLLVEAHGEDFARGFMAKFPDSGAFGLNSRLATGAQIELSHDAVDLLSLVQVEQDGGVSWGQALGSAEKWAEALLPQEETEGEQQ